MSAGFTPGPWHVFASGLADEAYGAVEINADDGLTVAYARNFVEQYEAQGNANARLIATAPELYRALDNAVRQYDAVKGGPIFGALEAARAVLAKARGEQVSA